VVRVVGIERGRTNPADERVQPGESIAVSYLKSMSGWKSVNRSRVPPTARSVQPILTRIRRLAARRSGGGNLGA